MVFDGYMTTTEAARRLGITPGALRDAVVRGRLAVVRIGDRNYVSDAELERYRTEVAGKRGWVDRRADGHETDIKAAARQRAYRQRKQRQ